MINTSEVQLNNVYGFVDVENYPRIFQINEINFTSLSEFPQDYRGISIDGEMLVRNSFFMKAGEAYFNSKHSIEVMEGDGEGYDIYFKGVFIRKVIFLHQLQNVIRTLTDEEIIRL